MKKKVFTVKELIELLSSLPGYTSVEHFDDSGTAIDGVEVDYDKGCSFANPYVAFCI